MDDDISLDSSYLKLDGLENDISRWLEDDSILRDALKEILPESNSATFDAPQEAHSVAAVDHKPINNVLQLSAPFLEGKISTNTDNSPQSLDVVMDSFDPETYLKDHEDNELDPEFNELLESLSKDEYLPMPCGTSLDLNSSNDGDKSVSDSKDLNATSPGLLISRCEAQKVTRSDCRLILDARIRRILKRKQALLVARGDKSEKQKHESDLCKIQKTVIAREKGESCLSIRKKVPKVGDLLCRENCRLKCSKRIRGDDRLSILKHFYKLDINAKNSLIFKSIERSTCAQKRKEAKKHKNSSYKYYVIKQGIRIQVCKEALCALYQVGRKKLDLIKSRLNSGASALPLEFRGKHCIRPPKNGILRHLGMDINKLEISC